MGVSGEPRQQVEIRWMSAPPSGQVKVNGLPVHPRGAESRWDAAIRQASRIAARQGGAVAAVIVAPGEPDENVHIDQDGNVRRREVSEIPRQEPEEPEGSTGWRPQTSPRSPTRAEMRRRQARYEPRKVQLSRLGVVAAGLVVVGALAGIFLLFNGDSRRGEQVTAAPLGYSTDASWSVGPVSTSLNVVPVKGGIAYVADDRTLHVVDTPSGESRWEGSMPAGEVKTGPVSMTVDGRESLVVLVGEELVWWSLEKGERHSVQVPSGATLFPRSTRPVLELGEGEAGTIKDDAVVRVALPKGATAVNAHSDGTIMAVSSVGWYALREGRPAKPTPFERPTPSTGGAPSIVGFLPAGGGQLVTVWPAQGAQGRYRVAVYSDGDRGFAPAFTAPLTATDPAKPLSLHWKPSPSGDWGVLGRYLVDVRAGAVRDLGDVSVATIAGDRARGIVEGQIVVVGPSMPTGVMTPQEPLPDVVTSDGAYVLDRQTRRLSLLPPAA